MIMTEDKVKIDQWVAKFPDPKGAVIMALRIMQDRHGWLSDDSINAVASYLKIAPVDVYEVVSFYSMYRRSPGGKHFVKICTSLSCCLAGAYDVIKHIEEKEGISLNKLDTEARITLQETECLGACQGAPVALVDDETYHLDLTPDKINTLIEGLDVVEEGQ